MATKKHKDEPQHEDMEKTPVENHGEIAPGCSTPNTVPPSVVGTTHDPKKQKEE